jgi:hypothetical protein
LREELGVVAHQSQAAFHLAFGRFGGDEVHDGDSLLDRGLFVFQSSAGAVPLFDSVDRFQGEIRLRVTGDVYLDEVPSFFETEDSAPITLKELDCLFEVHEDHARCLDSSHYPALMLG